jgi:hypothetical protein
MNNIIFKKFEYEDSDAVGFFIRNGFVLYRNVYDESIISECADYFFKCYNNLYKYYKKGEIEFDVNGWAVSIINAFEQTTLYESFIKTKNVIEILKNYIGPDIAVFKYDALWINVPKDKDPVLLKGQHTDAWTGTSVNTLFAKTFFTSVDQYNGMTVSPGSHLQGLVPVRNRNIDPIFNVKFDSINLSHVEMGDFLIWHPLLIHSTTGHSDKNIRISLTSRFTSTETTFSSQERALGYRTLNVGPMNQVLRLIGNDYLTPFRTYGGFVGIDRRLSDIYEHSEYQKIFDYTPYLI